MEIRGDYCEICNSIWEACECARRSIKVSMRKNKKDPRCIHWDIGTSSNVGYKTSCVLCSTSTSLLDKGLAAIQELKYRRKKAKSEKD